MILTAIKYRKMDRMAIQKRLGLLKTCGCDVLDRVPGPSSNEGADGPLLFLLIFSNSSGIGFSTKSKNTSTKYYEMSFYFEVIKHIPRNLGLARLKAYDF
jgi:hypothetical protein